MGSEVAFEAKLSLILLLTDVTVESVTCIHGLKQSRIFKESLMVRRASRMDLCAMRDVIHRTITFKYMYL